MAGKRTRSQLLHDMLCAIRDKGGQIKPTHLLYKANLSHQALRKYVSELTVQGLIEERAHGGNRVYALTDRGYYFLEEYRKFTEFADAFGI